MQGKGSGRFNVEIRNVHVPIEAMVDMYRHPCKGEQLQLQQTRFVKCL